MGKRLQRVATRNVWDTAYETNEKSQYECYGCGHRLSVEGSPIVCPECDGQLRNCEMPME